MASSRPSLLGSLGRQALGALSLAIGLALLGECAAHTLRGILVGEAKPDLALRCFKAAFFTPFRHSASYQALFASGIVLTLAGVALMRVWAMAFFAAAAACFAAFGGMVAERVVVPRGADALLLQDGCAGLWTLFTLAPEGMGRDPLMILWIGFAALIPGLYLTHLHKAARPAPAAAGPRRSPAPSFPVTPPNPAEAGADTVADLDLSPDLETSEVHAPLDEADGLPPMDLPPLEEASPAPEEPPLDTPAAGTEPEAPSGGAPEPEPVEEPPAEEPMPPEPEPVEEPPAEEARPPEPEPEIPAEAPGKALPAGALALGILSMAPAALLFFSPSSVPDAWAARALGGGMGLGLASFSLLLLCGRMGALGWAAAGSSSLGLAAAGTLIAVGG